MLQNERAAAEIRKAAPSQAKPSPQGPRPHQASGVSLSQLVDDVGSVRPKEDHNSAARTGRESINRFPYEVTNEEAEKQKRKMYKVAAKIDFPPFQRRNETAFEEWVGQAAPIATRNRLSVESFQHLWACTSCQAIAPRIRGVKTTETHEELVARVKEAMEFKSYRRQDKQQAYVEREAVKVTTEHVFVTKDPQPRKAGNESAQEERMSGSRALKKEMQRNEFQEVMIKESQGTEENVVEKATGVHNEAQQEITKIEEPEEEPSKMLLLEEKKTMNEELSNKAIQTQKKNSESVRDESAKDPAVECKDIKGEDSKETETEIRPLWDKRSNCQTDDIRLLTVGYRGEKCPQKKELPARRQSKVVRHSKLRNTDNLLNTVAMSECSSSEYRTGLESKATLCVSKSRASENCSLRDPEDCRSIGRVQILQVAESVVKTRSWLGFFNKRRADDLNAPKGELVKMSEGGNGQFMCEPKMDIERDWKKRLASVYESVKESGEVVKDRAAKSKTAPTAMQITISKLKMFKSFWLEPD